ncbi:hypothetical protein T484DRAFT_1808879 [Baffinella frigidus]|nr:hypothetical protein T484DRAFT_1808879 [Cryptophyta sp. CCMP2293]
MPGSGCFPWRFSKWEAVAVAGLGDGAVAPMEVAGRPELEASLEQDLGPNRIWGPELGARLRPEQELPLLRQRVIECELLLSQEDKFSSEEQARASPRDDYSPRDAQTGVEILTHVVVPLARDNSPETASGDLRPIEGPYCTARRVLSFATPEIDRVHGPRPPPSLGIGPLFPSPMQAPPRCTTDISRTDAAPRPLTRPETVPRPPTTVSLSQTGSEPRPWAAAPYTPPHPSSNVAASTFTEAWECCERTCCEACSTPREISSSFTPIYFGGFEADAFDAFEDSRSPGYYSQAQTIRQNRKTRATPSPRGPAAPTSSTANTRDASASQGRFTPGGSPPPEISPWEGGPARSSPGWRALPEISSRPSTRAPAAAGLSASASREYRSVLRALEDQVSRTTAGP